MEAAVGTPTSGDTAGSSEMIPPAAASSPASAALSRSVQTALAGLPADPIPVTVLIDAVLALHTADYLSSWPWTPPVWPDDLLRQPAGAWMDELSALLHGPLVFGRIAVLGWSLLDDRVAQAAQSSGMLAGVAEGVHPAVGDFLTPHGLELLRIRAPLVALAVSELPPVVEVQASGPVEAVAVGRQAPTVRGSSARWAAADSGSILVGRGTTTSRLDGLYIEAPEPTEGGPVAATETGAPTEKDGPGDGEARPRRETVFWRASPVLAMGWSRQGVLHVVTRGQTGALRYDPATQQSQVDGRWPAAESACVSETAVAIATKGGSLWWAPPDGDPVMLTETGPGPDAHLALARDRVAILDSGRVLTAGSESRWSEVASVGGATAFAATRGALVVGTSDGNLQALSWLPGPDETPALVTIFPGQAIVHASGAEGMVVVASTTTSPPCGSARRGTSALWGGGRPRRGRASRRWRSVWTGTHAAGRARRPHPRLADRQRRPRCA